MVPRRQSPGSEARRMSSHISNVRPPPDQVLVDIADYALNYRVESTLA